MKKLAILLAVLCAFSFAGCGDDKDDMYGNLPAPDGFDPNNPVAKEHIEYAGKIAEEGKKYIDERIETNEKETEKRVKEFHNNMTEFSSKTVFTYPDVAEMEFLAYGIEYSDLYDADIITIKANLTPLNEDNPMGFLNFVNYFSVYQDGVMLTMAFSDYDYETGTVVKAGKTLEIAFSYILRDTESSLEFEGGADGKTEYTCVLDLE